MEAYPYRTTLDTALADDDGDATYDMMVAALNIALDLAETLRARWPDNWLIDAPGIAHGNLMSLLMDRYVGQIPPERAEELSAMPYGEYLRTSEWQKRRWLTRLVQVWCQLCGTPAGPFHTHHRTYENRGEEPWWDLTLLCDKCHRSYHGK